MAGEGLYAAAGDENFHSLSFHQNQINVHVIFLKINNMKYFGTVPNTAISIEILKAFYFRSCVMYLHYF